MNENRCVVELDNGFKLVAEKGIDPGFEREMYIGIVDSDGVWHQDIVMILNKYTFSEADNADYEDGLLEVHVFADELTDGYTDSFEIKRYEEYED